MSWVNWWVTILSAIWSRCQDTHWGDPIVWEESIYSGCGLLQARTSIITGRCMESCWWTPQEESDPTEAAWQKDYNIICETRRSCCGIHAQGNHYSTKEDGLPPFWSILCDWSSSKWRHCETSRPTQGHTHTCQSGLNIPLPSRASWFKLVRKTSPITQVTYVVIIVNLWTAV